MSETTHHYAVLHPIKHGGTVHRSGIVELPESIGDALVGSGHLSPLPDAATPKDSGGSKDVSTAGTDAAAEPKRKAMPEPMPTPAKPATKTAKKK